MSRRVDEDAVVASLNHQMNVLTTEHLSRSVVGRKLVEDISIQVPAGGVLAVVGPSGSGKSSFLRLLNRLDEPTAGTVLFEGVDYRLIPPRDAAGGEDAGGARLEVLVDSDAAVERQAGTLGQRGGRPHAGTHHDEIGVDRVAAAQGDGSPVDRHRRLAQMKADAARLVERLDESPYVRTQDALARH